MTADGGILGSYPVSYELEFGALVTHWNLYTHSDVLFLELCTASSTMICMKHYLACTTLLHDLVTSSNCFSNPLNK